MPPIFDKDGNVIRPARFVPRSMANFIESQPISRFAVKNLPQINPFVEKSQQTPVLKQTCRQDIPKLEDLLEVPGVSREVAERFLNQLTRQYAEDEQAKKREQEQRNYEFRQGLYRELTKKMLKAGAIFIDYIEVSVDRMYSSFGSNVSEQGLRIACPQWVYLCQEIKNLRIHLQLEELNIYQHFYDCFIKTHS